MSQDKKDLKGEESETDIEDRHKIFNTNNQMNLEQVAPNSPQLLLLKFLPLTCNTAISWLPPLISHLFSPWLLEGRTFFYCFTVFD